MHDTGDDSGDGDFRTREKPAPELSWRLARAKDIAEYYPDNAPSGTMRAYVAEMDGEVVGVIGIVRDKDWGKYFSDTRPKLRPYLKSITIMRLVKQSLKLCDEYRGPVLAVAHNGESCRLLNRLGFTHLYGAWYGWLG